MRELIYGTTMMLCGGIGTAITSVSLINSEALYRFISAIIVNNTSLGKLLTVTSVLPVILHVAMLSLWIALFCNGTRWCWFSIEEQKYCETAAQE